MGGQPAKDLTPTGLPTHAYLVKGLGVGRGVSSLLLSSPPSLLGCQLEGSMIIDRLPGALDPPVNELPALGRSYHTLGPVATLPHPPLL